MSEKVKPIIIPAIIVALISCLIIVVYNATYKDTSGEVTDKQAAALVEIYGGGVYDVVPKDNWKDMFSEGDLVNITKVFRKADGSLAFEVVVKGYKNGFDIMVGVKDDKIAGVSVVSVGEETPGLGTNAAKPEFLMQFKDKSGTLLVVKNKTNPEPNEINAVTSATFSSKGVTNAANIAIKAYSICKEKLEVIAEGYHPEFASADTDALAGGETK